MAIQPSDEVNNLFMVLTGSRMPDINEDILRTVEDLYLEVAGDLGELQGHVEFLVAGVRRSFDGQAAEAFAMHMEQFVSGDISVLEGAAEQARALAAFASEVATEAEYMKLMIIAELIVLLVEIAIAAAMAYFSFGLSTALLPVKFAITRMLIRLGIQRLILRITSSPLFKTVVNTPWFKSFINSPWFKTVTQGVFIYGPIDGVIETGMSYGVQDYQIKKGNRGGFNDKHGASSFVSGYFSGLFQHVITDSLLRKFLPPPRLGRDGPGGFDLDPPGGGPRPGIGGLGEKVPPPVKRDGASGPDGSGPRPGPGPTGGPGPGPRTGGGPSPVRHLRLPIILTSVAVGTAIGETLGEVISGAAVYGRVDIDPGMPGLAATAAVLQSITEIKVAQPLGNWLGQLTFGPVPVVGGGTTGPPPGGTSQPPPPPPSGQSPVADEKSAGEVPGPGPVGERTPDRPDRPSLINGSDHRPEPGPSASAGAPRPPVVGPATIPDPLAPSVPPPSPGPVPPPAPLVTAGPAVPNAASAVPPGGSYEPPADQAAQALVRADPVRHGADVSDQPTVTPPEPPPSPVVTPVTPPPLPGDAAWTSARDNASVGVRAHSWGDPVHRFGPDGEQQLVVRSGFDARRVFHDGQWFTDLEVRVWIDDSTGAGPAGVDAVHDRLASGVREHLNSPGHQLGNGDRLHVTVLRADSPDSAHLTVNLVDRDQEMHQYSWWADAQAEYYTHELAHQLGLRDDRSGSGSIPGSLLGDFTAPKPTGDDVATPADKWHLWRDGGLRQRHLDLLDVLIGPVGEDGGYHGVDRPVRPAADEYAPRAPKQPPAAANRPPTTSQAPTPVDRPTAAGQRGIELDDPAGRPRPVDQRTMTTDAPESEPDSDGETSEDDDSDHEASDDGDTVRPQVRRPPVMSGALPPHVEDSDASEADDEWSEGDEIGSGAGSPSERSDDFPDDLDLPALFAEPPAEPPAEEPDDFPDDLDLPELFAEPPALPWYTQFDGALGQMYAYQAGPPPGQRPEDVVGRLLHDLVSGPTSAIFSAGQRDAIRRAVRAALIDLYTAPPLPPTPTDGPADNTPDPFIDERYSEFLEKWDRVLAQGITVQAGDRLVWIRPVIDNGRPHQRTRTGPAPYKVVFGSGSTNTSRGGGVDRGIPAPMDLMLVGLSGFARRISRLMFNFPFKLEGGFDTSSTENRTLVAGRQMFVKNRQMFDVGLRFDVYADGRQFGSTGTAPPERSGLTVVVPEQYARRDNGWPGARETTPAPQQLERQRVTRARPVLNAIGLTTLVIQWHRQLARSRLTPQQRVAVAEAGTRQLLNERSLINRSTHLLSNGVRTDALSVGGLTGNLSLTITPTKIQYIGSAPGVEVRDDMSVVLSQSDEATATSGLAFDPSFTAIGMVDPGTDTIGRTGQRATGTLGVDLKVSGGESLALDLSTDVSNHVVLVRRSDQARYLVHYRVALHTELDGQRLASVSLSDVPAELGVAEPERASFERAIAGSALSRGVTRWTRTGPGPLEPFQYRPRQNLDRLLGVSPPGNPRQPTPPPSQPRARPAVPVPHYRGRRIAAPTAGEPLALATRRGTGWGVPVSLPRSEVVVLTIERALPLIAGVQRLDRDTAQTIVQRLGRPSLEADLNRHLAGDPFTVTVGGKDYDIMLTVYLEEHRDSSQYPMSVNTRTIVAHGHSGTIADDASVAVAFSGGPVIPVAKAGRVALPFSVEKGRSAGHNDDRSVSVESYRRTETTGDVIDNGYGVAYVLVIRESKVGAQRHTWVFGSEAGIVTPVEHIPDTPLTLDQVRRANTLTSGAAVLAQWSAMREDIDSVDFVRFDLYGVNAVETAFVTMPELVALAADLYRQTTGQSQEWFDDPLNWPRELWQIGIPNHLNAHFAELTDGRGWIVSLDNGITSHMVLIIRARVVPPGTGRVSGTVEIEHYLKRVGKHELGAEKGSSNKVGFAPSGSYLAPNPSGGDEAAIGRADVEIAGVGRKWSTGEENAESAGSADISRATYGGDQGIFQGDVLIEASIVEWNDLKDLFQPDRPDQPTTTTHTGYLKVPRGLDFMMPVEIADELSLPLPARPTDPATPATGSDPPAPVTGTDAPAPATGVDPATAPAAPVAIYSDPDLAQALGHPERLQAGPVLTFIEETMRTKGLIPAGNRHTLLRRAVRAQFASMPLENQWTALVGSGVRGLFVVPSPLRNLRMMLIEVTGRFAGAPTASGSRHDVDLLLRGEALDGSSRSENQGDEWTWTVVKIKGYGKPTDATDAGASGGLAYSREHESDLGVTQDDKDIFRVGVKGGATQFIQPMEFEVRIGLTNHKPYWMQLISATLRETFFLTTSLRDGGEQWARQIWFDNRLGEWDWESATAAPLTGTAKLLVPTYLAETADQRGRWVSSAAQRPAGFPAAPPVHWGTPPASRPQANRDLLADQSLHPWTLVKVAQLVRAFAGLTTLPAQLSPTSVINGRVPGLPWHSVVALALGDHADGSTMRSRVWDLLDDGYRIPGTDITVNIDIRAVQYYESSTGEPLTVRKKGRRYGQKEASPSAGTSSGSRTTVTLGPSGRGDVAKGVRLGTDAPFTVEQSREAGGELSIGDVSERNVESVRSYYQYRYDVTVYVSGPAGTLVIDVPDGFLAMSANPPARLPAHIPLPPGSDITADAESSSSSGTAEAGYEADSGSDSESDSDEDSESDDAPVGDPRVSAASDPEAGVDSSEDESSSESDSDAASDVTVKPRRAGPSAARGGTPSLPSAHPPPMAADVDPQHDPIFAALTPSSESVTAPPTPVDASQPTTGEAELTRASDRHWYLDGQQVLGHRLTGDRTGLALLDEADLVRLSPVDLLSPGEIPAAVVRGAGDQILAPVQDADGRTRQVPVTPGQLAMMTAPLTNLSGTVALIIGDVTAANSGFVSAYASAMGVEVLVLAVAPRGGSPTGPPQVPVPPPEQSSADSPWRLFAPVSRSG
ncbi:hypothetical protein EDC02_2079 [Micromonospora sp. Llam0]|uniref:WXG100-like domain-containing protein n=1 Tax=Micromonospora sp. Llam0 TaxID=2485143 RepID=UPI000F45F525|nr:hypothetical protein [Micromonospora sp. Llam0]ROO60220.1 hypothetical protein EDC02_2079 [Micromonospora sp. Llam0]